MVGSTNPTSRCEVGGPAYIGDAGLVGGSIEVDETARQEATKALNDVVSEWPSAQATSPALPQEETAPTSIGATAWRPVDETPVLEGRYVSESPHLSRVVEVPDVKPQKMPKKAPFATCPTQTPASVA